MMVKEVVEHADNCIGPLPHIRCLIDDKVDQSRDSFTADPKKGSLPGGEEVDGAWL